MADSTRTRISALWMVAAAGVLAATGAVGQSADEAPSIREAVKRAEEQAAVLPACQLGSVPACAGACPPYNTCQAIRFGAMTICSCVGELAVCGVNDPLCGGVCPPGLVCAGDVFGTGPCQCEEPLEYKPPSLPERPPEPPIVREPAVKRPVPVAIITTTTTVRATTTSERPTTTARATTTSERPTTTVRATTTSERPTTTVRPTTTLAPTTTLRPAPRAAPLQCGASGYPACGGTCSAGGVCMPHVDTGGAAACRCGIAPKVGPLCGSASAPACDGACPAGTACMEDSNVGACACFDVFGATCGFLGPPECAGACPPETPVCRDDGAGRCVCTR